MKINFIPWDILFTISLFKLSLNVWAQNVAQHTPGFRDHQGVNDFIDDTMSDVYNVYLLAIVDHDKSALWDFDYLHELFPFPKFHMLNRTRFLNNNPLEPPTVVQCNCREHARLIRNYIQDPRYSNATFRILFHNDDEYMGKSREHYHCTELYEYFKIVFRTYAYYGNRNTSNIMHIPPGYMSTMLSDPDPTVDAKNLSSLSVQQLQSSHMGPHHHQRRHHVHNHEKQLYPRRIHHTSLEFAKFSLSKTSDQRYYNWSFVGNLGSAQKYKSRLAMIKIMEAWHPHNISLADSGDFMTPYEMRHLYNDSRFAVIGKGWNTYDCLRIYEAIICGAIPIVVGYWPHVWPALLFNDTLPPCIYEEDWTEVLAIVQKMSNEDIDKKRVQLYNWYADMWGKIQDTIAYALQ